MPARTRPRVVLPNTLLGLPLALLSGLVSTAPFDEDAFAAIVWDNAPDVLAARAQVIEADAARDHSHLLPNPTVGGDWATIPLGTRTGGAPFWDVPNYTFGISSLLEIGKRGPRQEAAEAARSSARFVSLDAYRRSFFAALEALSRQAAAAMRAAVLRRLVASSDEGLRLQSARAEKGDVAGLQVDRSRVEHLRLLSALRGAEVEVEDAALVCMRIVGSECPRFTSEDEATRFLLHGSLATTADAIARTSDRADIRALGAEGLRLQAELVLARRLKVPDITFGVAYTHDTFVLAGNQANSISISLSLSLPVFDRGQIEVARTERRLRHNARMVEILSASAHREVELGDRQLVALRERARALEDEALPQAREVLERTEAAVQRGGGALPDILLVRRALEELVLDRVEALAAIHRVTLDRRRAAADLPQPRMPGW